MNTDYIEADFQATQMKWDSTLEQKGPGYFALVWERRRLCSGSKSSTLWGDGWHGLRYPNWRPFIYQKAVFYILEKLSMFSNPNAYWLTYIVHAPILNIQLAW